MSDSSPEENHEANERPNTPTQSQSDNPATNNDGVQKGPRGKRNKSNANQASAPLGKVSLKPKIRQKKSGSLVPAPKKPVNTEADVPGPTTLRRRAVTSAVGALPAKQKGESHKPPLRRFSSETFWHSWDRSPQQIYKTINPITGEIQCRTYSSTFTVQEDQGDEEDDEEEEEDEEEETEDEISGEKQILDSKEKEVEEILSKGSETQPQEKKKDKGKGKSKSKSKLLSQGKSKRTIKDKSAKEGGGDATIAEREKQMKKQMLINMREYSKTLTSKPATRGGSLIVFKSGSSGSPATRHSFSTPSPSPSPSTLTPRDLMAELIIDLWPSSAPSPREGGEAKESNVSAGSLDALVAAFFGDIGRDQLGN